LRLQRLHPQLGRALIDPLGAIGWETGCDQKIHLSACKALTRVSGTAQKPRSAAAHGRVLGRHTGRAVAAGREPGHTQLLELVGQIQYARLEHRTLLDLGLQGAFEHRETRRLRVRVALHARSCGAHGGSRRLRLRQFPPRLHPCGNRKAGGKTCNHQQQRL
jgi:hypothetical protein